MARATGQAHLRLCTFLHLLGCVFALSILCAHAYTYSALSLLLFSGGGATGAVQRLPGAAEQHAGAHCWRLFAVKAQGNRARLWQAWVLASRCALRALVCSQSKGDKSTAVGSVSASAAVCLLWQLQLCV